jgi:alkaline phosphatase D
LRQKSISCVDEYLIFIALLYVAFVVFSYQQSYGQKNKFDIDQGIASGDVTNDSAVIWSRSNSDSIMNVQYNSLPHFNDFSPINVYKTKVDSSTNYTGHIKLTNLNPNTTYYYKTWFSDVSDSVKSNNFTGKFKTAPNKDMLSKEINFVIGGDLSGSSTNATLCRQLGIGYPIFSVMKSINPDFFIFNGDQIYADNTCPYNITNTKYPYWKNIPGNFSSVDDIDWNNNSMLYDTFLAHWKYNREDPHLRGFLNSTSFYSQADDHEVNDNYGGLWKFLNPSFKKQLHNKTGYHNLVKIGIDVFFKFSPIQRNQTDPDRIYRMFNWGKDFDLFLLDAHSYRSLNDLPDTIQNNKTLYGEQQLDWLKKGLLASNSAWKIISNPVPITLPDCYGEKGECNNWATNSSLNQLTFTRERNQFLRFLDQNNIKNVIFITTDVHFAGTVKVEQDFDGDGDKLIFYEMANGPLSTGTRDIPNAVDPTIRATYLYSENAIFNFGHLKLTEKADKKIHLIYQVIDSNGRIRPGSLLDLLPMN